MGGGLPSETTVTSDPSDATSVARASALGESASPRGTAVTTLATANTQADATPASSVTASALLLPPPLSATTPSEGVESSHGVSATAVQEGRRVAYTWRETAATPPAQPPTSPPMRDT